jgi:hypothetical protein
MSLASVNLATLPRTGESRNPPKVRERLRRGRGAHFAATGLFLLPAAASPTFAEGEYRIKPTYRRQGAGLIRLSQGGDVTDEIVTLKAPWTTPTEIPAAPS